MWHLWGNKDKIFKPLRKAQVLTLSLSFNVLHCFFREMLSKNKIREIVFPVERGLRLFDDFKLRMRYWNNLSFFQKSGILITKSLGPPSPMTEWSGFLLQAFAPSEAEP